MTKMLYILTEERSMESYLRQIIPKLYPYLQFRIIPHEGKQDLRRNLQKTVPTLSKVHSVRILILHDKDSSDCVLLKKEILETVQHDCQCPMKVVIVCHELEAWYLGDTEGLRLAFNRFSTNQISQRYLDNPDLLPHPKEVITRQLKEVRNKAIGSATKIGTQSKPERNTSPSFKYFLHCLSELSKIA